MKIVYNYAIIIYKTEKTAALSVYADNSELTNIAHHAKIIYSSGPFS